MIKTKSIPFWITYLFIIVSVFENILPMEAPLYIVGIGVLGIVFLKKGLRLKKSNVLLWLPFILYGVISCIWSPNPSALQSMFNFIVPIAFLILQAQFNYSAKEFERFKTAFIIQGAVLVLLCYLFGTYKNGRFWILLNGYGVDPNYLSAWCILPICFIVERFFDKSIRWYLKAAMVFVAVSLLYYVLESGSRSGLIVVGGALIMSVLYRSKENIKRHPVYAIIIFCSAVGIVYIIYKMLPQLMIQRLLSANANLGGRGRQWRELLSAMNSNILIPIFGRGYGSVTYYTTGNMVAHNTYLDVLFAEGIPGLALYLLFLLPCVWRLRLSEQYLFIGSCAMMIMLFVLTALSVRSTTLWYFMIWLGAKLSKPHNKRETL